MCWLAHLWCDVLAGAPPVRRGFSLHAGVYSCAPSVRQSWPGCARGPLPAGQVPVPSVGVSAAGTGPTRRALRADAQDSLARWHPGRAPDSAGADRPVGSADAPTGQANDPLQSWLAHLRCDGVPLRRTMRCESWWSRRARRRRDGARTGRPTQPQPRWTARRHSCAASCRTTRPAVAACHGRRR